MREFNLLLEYHVARDSINRHFRIQDRLPERTKSACCGSRTKSSGEPTFLGVAPWLKVM
jgi:hypothetical protein